MRLSVRTLVLFGALCVACIQLSVMGYRLSQSDGLMLASGQPMFGDFIAFWSAGQLALSGDVALVHDADALQATQASAVPGLSVYAPYHSPPPFLLLITPIALLPYAPAALLFLGISAAIYGMAATRVVSSALGLCLAALLPAGLFHLGSVQTGLLIAGAAGLAAAWLDKRPVLASLCIALISVKPHLGLLWPVFLALSGRWRVFGLASLFAAALWGAAGLVFGFEAYCRFWGNLSAAHGFISDERVAPATYASLYGALIGLGTPEQTARIVHFISACGAIGVSVLVFRGGDRRLGVAALCAAGMLMSPYLFFYDATLLGLAAALFGAPRTCFGALAVALCWAAGLSLALGAWISLPLCPLAGWSMLLAISARTRSAPALQGAALRM